MILLFWSVDRHTHSRNNVPKTFHTFLFIPNFRSVEKKHAGLAGMFGSAAVGESIFFYHYKKNTFYTNILR
jgi:hypothetical protein